MKKKILYSTAVAFILGLSINHKVLAQNDKITYSVEEKDTAHYSVGDRYDYITRAHIEEKSMFRIGVRGGGISSGPSNFPRIHTFTTVEFERKIGIQFSFVAGVNAVFQSSPFASSASLNASLRYYYNMRKRVRKGMGANNLSANYFAARLSNIAGLSFTSDQSLSFEPKIQVLYGLQRRLGKRWYFNAAVGPGINLTNGHFDLINFDVSIGIGF
ncbi:MAG: hypothetical protein COC01_08295 [Bacteroidetes bacterium]|nr:hypothetical protein [Bacteroidia bacterium]PCH66336.1 MAG: hypothetical protein COC01_08295 [Bacteroidota bacterium]